MNKDNADANRPPSFEKDLTGVGPTSLPRTNEDIWDSEEGKFRDNDTRHADYSSTIDNRSLPDERRSTDKNGSGPGNRPTVLSSAEQVRLLEREKSRTRGQDTEEQRLRWGDTTARQAGEYEVRRSIGESTGRRDGGLPTARSVRKRFKLNPQAAPDRRRVPLQGGDAGGVGWPRRFNAGDRRASPPVP